MLAIFLALQAGTTFIYQGQELGMTNVPKDWGMEEYKDVDCLNHWRQASGPFIAEIWSDFISVKTVQ
jgi:glycosidase